MAVMRGIPSRYRLRLKQRLAVVEYVQHHGIKAGESAVWVGEAHRSAVVAELATGRYSRIGAAVPGPAPTPDR